jgi:hypothetical protein
MKKTTIIAMLLLAATFTFAQSEKYTKKMTELLTQMDTIKTSDQWTSLGATFERIADAEKTQWVPYYYASLALLNGTQLKLSGGLGDNAAITDPAADKAEELLNKALALTKENSETWIIKKMIASMRMMGNPMQRYMQYGAIAAEALETAKAMNENNPRIYLLQGQDKYYTPEQFGGDKEEARKLFNKVIELSKTFKPETALHPNWGATIALYMLTLKD